MRCVFLLLAGLVACDDGVSPVPVASIETIDSAEVMVDSSVAIAAEARSATGASIDAPLTWTSLDTLIATVSAAGIVTARSIGPARIVVSADSASDTVQIRGIIRIAEATAAGGCARSVDGLVFCIGNRVAITGRATKIAGHPFALHCALTQGGAAWCWGIYPPGNGAGSSDEPVQVAGHAFTDIAVGSVHACGLKANGSVWCWGESHWSNLTSAYGHGIDVPAPVQVASGPFSAITASWFHTCGLGSSGPVCWGDNMFDALGIAGNPGGCMGEPCVAVPTAATFDSTFTSVVTAGDHGCGLTAAGQAWCWGDNGWAQLGDSSWTGCAFWPNWCSTRPQRVNTSLRFASLMVSYHRTCGLTSGGAAYCWGRNASQELGTGSTADRVYRPEPVVGGHTFQSLNTRDDETTCGVTSDGLWCWGFLSPTPQRLPNFR